MEPQPKVLYTNVRTAARPRPRLRNGQANLVPSRFHLLSCFGILAVVIAAHFFITRQPWRSTRAEVVPDSTEARVVRNDVPNFCFVHITNKVVSFDPRDQSLYQTSMYHVFDYTVRHGYQYFRVVDVSGQEGYLVGVWSKVKHVIRLIDLCKHVVVMDTDVFIASQQVPFTSMLKDWGYTSDTLVVGYTDSRACYKIDHQYMTEYVCNEEEMKVVGNRQMNTGFVVFKNHPKVKRLLKYWYACRDPVVNKWNASQVLENCGGLRYDRPYSLDQTVWNGVIRPKFAPVELLLVGCEYVGQGPFDPICIGKHFQHRMYDKYKNETKGYIERDMAAKYNETERLSLITSLINGNHVRLWY